MRYCIHVHSNDGKFEMWFMDMDHGIMVAGVLRTIYNPACIYEYTVAPHKRPTTFRN